MLLSWLASWAGMTAGVAADPLIAAYALIGAGLVRSIRWATLYAILGGIVLSFLISWMTFDRAQAVVPGISFVEWAGRPMLARVSAILVIVTLGLGLKKLTRRGRHLGSPSQEAE